MPDEPDNTRIERDSLGEVAVPADALFGAHTVRALENFPLARRPVHPMLVRAFGAVKLAAARVNLRLGYLELDEAAAQAVLDACQEMRDGGLTEHVVVDALQGGAGTSTNMNVNEVIANAALLRLDKAPGDARTISPLGHINLHQSTNDTFPTALKVAALALLSELEAAVVRLQEALQDKEKALAHIVKVGRTQLQDAVLTTVGRQFGAYAEAMGRDRWRIYKCQERLRGVNLGGTAIGTGLGAPRRYIFAVVDELRAITGLPLARAENLLECTQNADVFAEVSGILCAHAVSLEKMANDLRLLSSGPSGIGELRLPPRQVGSSIMPGKVNPVIPEAAAQVAMQVRANDGAVKSACAAGSLELNPFLPLVAENLLSNLSMLIGAVSAMERLCIRDLAVDEARVARQVAESPALATALSRRLGYDTAAEVVRAAERTQKSIREVVLERGLLTPEELDAAFDPYAVCKLGD